MTVHSSGPPAETSSNGRSLTTADRNRSSSNRPAKVLSVIGAVLAVLPISAMWFLLSTKSTVSSGGVSTTTIPH